MAQSNAFKFANNILTNGKFDVDDLSATVGGENTPAFFATMSTDQNSIADVTFTKVNFDTERFDTDNAYDTSTYRFTVPSGKAGKYFFLSKIWVDGTAAQNFETVVLEFYVNGSQNVYGLYGITGQKNESPSVSAIFDLAVGDYIETYVYGDVTSGGTFNVNNDTTTLARCVFYGYKLIT